MNSTTHVSHRSHRASILVVDDDEAILILVRYCLQREGYQVACASGRAPVLALLAGGHYDLVITDVLMPEIDGTEVLAVTKAHQPDAAVLAMSGGGPQLTAEYSLQLARSLGGANPLQKPFHVEELLTAVRRALQSRPRAAAAYVFDSSAVLM